MRKQPKPPLNDTFPTPREPWTARGFFRFIKDRPHIWHPPVWGLVAIWAFCGEYAIFIHMSYLTNGGQPNFLSFFFPVCTILLVYAVVWYIRFCITPKADTYALIALLAGLVCMVALFFSVAVLLAIYPDFSTMVDLATLNWDSEQFYLFGGVTETLQAMGLVMLPFVCYSLVALLIAGICHTFKPVD